MGIINTQAEATDSFPPWIKPSPLILPQLNVFRSYSPLQTQVAGGLAIRAEKEKEIRGIGRGMDGWHGAVRGAFYSVGGTHISLVCD